MSDSLTRFYHILPPFARSWAASLRGFYLQSWRYDSKTELLVQEALEREWWSPGQWKKWQDERLAHILERAEKNVPFYRAFWQKRKTQGKADLSRILENWPFLEKEALRIHPKEFVADDRNIRHLYPEHTSGTTGKPLNFWLSREAIRIWYALFEARCRRWHGVSRHDRWAILGGQLIVPVRCKQPPFWVWNAPMHQLYLSTFHLAPQWISHYLDAICRYRIQYLYGYPSSLNVLAQGVIALKRDDIKMKVVLTNAEPLLPYQRQNILEAFQCPVRETYGMSETVAAASECEKGKMHLWPEAGIPESGNNSELICTGLLNADMPLIRYRVGDRVILEDSCSLCGCGRTLPVIHSIEGRADDILYTRDGRAIGRLDPVFKAHLPIREAQIIQESLEKFRIKFVPSEGFVSSAEKWIKDQLRERVGDVEIILEQVKEIPRSANGKFRAVICNLPSEDRKALKSAGPFA